MSTQPHCLHFGRLLRHFGSYPLQLGHSIRARTLAGPIVRRLSTTSHCILNAVAFPFLWNSN